MASENFHAGSLLQLLIVFPSLIAENLVEKIAGNFLRNPLHG